MAVGLQIWDAAGAIQLDTTTALLRILGTQSITAANQSGNLTNTNLAQGPPWYFIIGQTDPFTRPDVTFAGNVMTWTVVYTGFVGTILYGVR